MTSSTLSIGNYSGVPPQAKDLYQEDSAVIQLLADSRLILSLTRLTSHLTLLHITYFPSNDYV
jgi:hypothetical protein